MNSSSAIGRNSEQLASLAQHEGIVDDNLLKFIKITDRSNISLENYKAYLKSTGQTTSAFAGLTKKAGDALKSFGAVLASMAVMWAVGEAVQIFYDNIVKGQENVIAKGEEAKNAILSAEKQLQDSKTTLTSIGKEYAKLSKGVDYLGNNVSLTNEEYVQYHKVTNEIADKFPELIQGYDDEGNAILRTKGNLEELNKAYEEQKRLVSSEILSNIQDFANGFNIKVNPVSEEDLYTLKGQAQLIQQYWGDGDLRSKKMYLSNFLAENSNNTSQNLTFSVNNDILANEIKKQGIEIKHHYNELGNVTDRYIENTAENRKKLAAQLHLYQNELDQQAIMAKTTIQSMTHFDSGYANLSESGKRMADAIIQGYENEWYTSQTFEESQNKILSIVDTIENLQEKNITKNFDNLLDLQTQFQNGEVTFEEYNDKLSEFYSQLSMFDNETVIAIRMLFEPKTADGYTVTDINEILKRTLGDNSVGELDPAISNYLMDVSEEVRTRLFEGLENGKINITPTLSAVKEAVSQIENEISKTPITKPFLEYTNALGETVSYTQEEFEKLFSLGDKDNPFDGLINSANEYVAALKAVDTEMSTVESALKEYNEKGSISAETADKLLKANGDYSKSLVYTKDGIKLNTQALKDETKAYIDILIEKYKDQIATNENTIATNNATIASNNRKIALNEERKAIINKTIADATDTKTKASLLSQKVKSTVSNVKTSAENKKLQAEAEAAEKAANEAQEQIDLLRGDLNTLSDDAFGAYVPPEEKNNASSSTPKTKSYEKNTNAYNWADAWLQDQQNNADKLKAEYDKINKQLDKAIELGDEELIRSLSENAVEKSKQIQEVQASAASEGRTRYADIMKEIWSMAPELQDKSIDDITEDDLLKVEKRLDDIITKEKNIAVDMYNANNDAVDPNQAAIEAAENNANRWDELIKNAQEYYKAFGEVSGEGSFAEDWAEQGDNIVETVKTTFDAVNDIFDTSVENQQRELDKLDLRIDLLDDGDFSGQMDLIAQKSQINTEIAKNLADQIESIKSEFEDSLLPEDEYKSRMEELEDQYNDCIKAGKEFEDTLKDIAQEQIDNISSVENNVMGYLEDYLKAVEDNSQKEIDAAEKTADAKKKALDKAKDALKDYQDELEKEWQAEDDRSARQEKLDQRSDLSSQRSKSLAAAASGDLEALSKVEELDKEIADIDKDIQEEATKQIRDMLKDYIAKQEDDLDKQADKIDEEIDLMKQQLEEAQKMNEELLKGESGIALVHALMNGESVKLNGKEVDLDTIRTSVDTENGNAFSYGYENETSEWQENLSKSLAAVANLESLNELAQGNFTLQNGNILLSNGHSFDTSMLSTTNPNSIVNGLIPVNPDLLPINPLANGEAIMSSLGIGKTLYDNSEIIQKMGDIQKSIDNNNNPPSFTVQGNLLNVEGNVMEDTVPMINNIVAKQIPNILMSWEKGVSRNAALIKYNR